MGKLTLILDPTPKRAAVIALCIFGEALIIPLVGIVQGLQRMPTDLEILLFVMLALLQLITYVLGFLGFQGSQST